MNVERRDFDKEAATWDEVPTRVKLANDIAAAISEEIVLTSNMDVLDFGCGTGLLTLQLQPVVHSITGVDSSQGMIDVLKAKIDKKNLPNVRTQYIDTDTGDILKGSYHLIVTSMTLHHVKEIRPLFDQFHGIVAPSGYLCIADLDIDDGKFHGNNNGVFHFGFDRAVLRQDFTEAGFRDIRDRTAAEVMKPVSDGGVQPFSVFLMTGRKKP
jgi:2-polyprenyl-3-methyl-5-hydroxy-6-metoxy-1,4-benzoquinol methylase